MENETPIPAFGPDVAISIISCTSTRGIGPVYITDDIPFMLLPTECMDGAISYLMELFLTKTPRSWKLIWYTGSTVLLYRHLFLQEDSGRGISLPISSLRYTAARLLPKHFQPEPRFQRGEYWRTVQNNNLAWWYTYIGMTVSGSKIIVIDHLRDNRYDIFPLWKNYIISSGWYL